MSSCQSQYLSWMKINDIVFGLTGMNSQLWIGIWDRETGALTHLKMSNEVLAFFMVRNMVYYQDGELLHFSGSFFPADTPARLYVLNGNDLSTQIVLSLGIAEHYRGLAIRPGWIFLVGK